ncbi:hypothetical protein RRG08_027802 [Elysia crispata]|uniref:Uncharacterized protein n=1 Tax=Elysia crispata TaxID=231223 RepID=A0AAE0YVW4_9GAST|nr:hypothetical protein RRG08_027802 [Elysia crispata]
MVRVGSQQVNMKSNSSASRIISGTHIGGSGCLNCGFAKYINQLNMALHLITNLMQGILYIIIHPSLPRTLLFHSPSPNFSPLPLSPGYYVPQMFKARASRIPSQMLESHLEGMNDNERNLIRIIHYLENVGRRRR